MSQTIEESIIVEKQIVAEKSVIDQIQPIGYTPEPIAEETIAEETIAEETIAEETTDSICGIGTESVNGICKIIMPDKIQSCFLFWCW